MRYQVDWDGNAACQLTEALQMFRNEPMEEICLYHEGIPIEFIQKMFNKSDTSVSVSLNYRDTKIYLDTRHIVLEQLHSATSPASVSGD